MTTWLAHEGPLQGDRIGSQFAVPQDLTCRCRRLMHSSRQQHAGGLSSQPNSENVSEPLPISSSGTKPGATSAMLPNLFSCTSRCIQGA